MWSMVSVQVSLVWCAAEVLEHLGNPLRDWRSPYSRFSQVLQAFGRSLWGVFLLCFFDWQQQVYHRPQCVAQLHSLAATKVFLLGAVFAAHLVLGESSNLRGYPRRGSASPLTSIGPSLRKFLRTWSSVAWSPWWLRCDQLLLREWEQCTH